MKSRWPCNIELVPAGYCTLKQADQIILALWHALLCWNCQAAGNNHSLLNTKQLLKVHKDMNL